jgi:hypothetical protein
MIDFEHETLIPLHAAPRHQLLRQGRRPGRPVHRGTLERWRTRGRRGIKLETFLLGGIRMTTEEAILRFIERMSDPAATPDAITPSQMRKAHDAAERELSAAGL